MGCFIECFGGAKDHKRRRQRCTHAANRIQRTKVENVQQGSLTSAEQIVTGTPQTNLVSELQNKPAGKEKLSPSPRKIVTFNSNITTYEHVSVQESIESLTQCNENVGRENQDDLKTTSPSFSLSEDDSSVITSVASYPPNHRYHNARESDDEAEEYGDSDLDDLDDSDYEDAYDEHSDDSFSGQQVWVESSIESRTEHTAAQAIHEGVESRKANASRTRDNARGRNDYVNSVLNPIENIAQWKAAKSKGTHQLKPEEKLTAKSGAGRVSFNPKLMLRQELTGVKSKSEQQTKENQETAVDASLSKWLVSPEITHKKTSFSGINTLTSRKTM